MLFFFAYFSVSQKRNIKRNPNGMKPSRGSFLNKRNPGDLEWTSRKQRGGHEAGGRAPTLVGPLQLHRPTSSSYVYISIYPKNIQEHNRLGVPPPQASVATKNQSGPYSGTLPEGSLTGGHLHHPSALHDEEGVVHPRG